jgi:hypothetical protein
VSQSAPPLEQQRARGADDEEQDVEREHGQGARCLACFAKSERDAE